MDQQDQSEQNQNQIVANKKPETMKTVFQQINLNNLIYEKRDRKQLSNAIPFQVLKQIKKINNKEAKKPGRKKKIIDGPTEPNEPIEPTLATADPVVLQEEIGSAESASSFEPQKLVKLKKLSSLKKLKSSVVDIPPIEKSEDNAFVLARLNKIFKKSYESKSYLGEQENAQIQQIFKNYYERWIKDLKIDEEELEELQNKVDEGQNKVDECQVPNGKQIHYLSEDGLCLDTRRNLKLLDIQITNHNNSLLDNQTFINCDLRYFNLDYLVERIGHFDVVLMDPPWRIKGGQQNDSQFMFTNSKFSLEYNTMSNQEIMDIRIERLSKKGFLFLWILNTQLNLAYEMANKWGYEIVDQIIWVKLNSQCENVYLSTGYYFMHSFEICLVGYKCPPGEHVEYHSKISNNVLFQAVRTKSQKPIQLYEIIELMMPGSKKIELFARNNNLRTGWFSLGNQLGETFKKWKVEISCNMCDKSLRPGNVRFKSKKIPNYDICQECFELILKEYQQRKEVHDAPAEEKPIQVDEPTPNPFDPNSFFELMNKADEEILHQYHSCNHCSQEPIWGVRFECINCENYDLCESCFDLVLADGVHPTDHNFRATEIPIFAEGIPCHDAKCNGCFQKPILGVQFVCKQCVNFNLCQNCFFSKTQSELSGLRHKADHKLEPIYETQNVFKKAYKCQGCELEVNNGNAVYKCENCFGFYFCEKCFVMKKDDWKCYTATSHKNYHKYFKLE